MCILIGFCWHDVLAEPPCRASARSRYHPTRFDLDRRSPTSQPFALIRPAGSMLDPAGIVQVPLDGAAHARGKVVLRPPAQFPLDLGRRRWRSAGRGPGRSGTKVINDEQGRAAARDATRRPAGRSPRPRPGWPARNCRRCCRSRPAAALASTTPKRPAMVLDEQPVADVLAVAVDRQRLAFQGVEDHQRDAAFRETGRGRSCSSNWSPAPAGRRCG